MSPRGARGHALAGAASSPSAPANGETDDLTGVESLRFDDRTIDARTIRGAPDHDFNGDGTSDILWRDGSSGLVATWDLRNNQMVGGHYVEVLGLAQWQIKGTGDFNGDGTEDMLMYRASDGLVSVWAASSPAAGKRRASGPLQI